MFCEKCGKKFGANERVCSRCGTQTAISVANQSRSIVLPSGDVLIIAEPFRRIGAQMFDVLFIVFLCVIISSAYIAVSRLIYFQRNSDIFPGCVLLWFVYYLLGNSSGKTIGKRVFGIAVIRSSDHDAPGVMRGLMRTICQFTIIELVGYVLSRLPYLNLEDISVIAITITLVSLVIGMHALLMARNMRKQTWYDKVSGTLVVKD